jgi:hypothetical protein
MCQSKQLKRHKGNIFSALSVGILAFLFTALVPAQAFAVTGGTCNSDLEWYLEGPGAFPDTQWFVNDVMKVKATFKAGAITGGTGPEYLQIPDFGFAADCEAVPGGLTWGNCILKNPASVDITFLGKPVNDPVQTCKNPAGTAINFLAPESNRITFTPTNGPIQLPEGSSCKMSWNFQVTDLNGATSVKLNQVAAFAAGSKSAECVYYSGGQKFIGTTSSGRNAVVTVNSCEIEVKKQICDVDGSDCTVEGNWYDADTVGTALDLSPSGRAAYRAIITNTGSVAYTGDITINDGPLDTSWTAKSLAPGASVTVGGAGTVANWSDYCKTHASVSNTIEVDAMCRTGDSPVSAHATNEAWGICNYIPPATGITIEKATNGQDADIATGPLIPVGAAVTWSYVVRNTSNVTLTDISASDDKEGAITCPKTTLVAGEEMTCTSKIGTATAGQYANLASVSGKYGSDTVNDTDPSHYFGTGDANILLVKEISVDDGATWKDANNVGSAAIAVYPSDALYRFTVTNNGNAPLKDVIVNDSELGIIDYPIGDMAVDEVVVITSTEEPLLAVEDRCDSRGTFVNTAVASGASAETGTPVSDSDPAVLKCIGEPHITIVKEISPTGGEPWYDDETPPQEFPSDAWYRITVTNDGTAPLENVEVLDGDLSVDEVIGNLAVDETVVLTSAQVTALYQKDRCNGSGRVGNTASVSGNSVDDPDDTVDDSDTATLVCVGLPALDVIKEISVNNVDWFDANTEEDAVLAQAPSNAWYRITVKNTGLVDMTNVVLNDGTLGIVDYPVGTIAAGQEVMLTSGDIPKLYYPGRCTGKGTFGNTATAKGTSSETGSESSDSDEAWLECTGTPDIQIVKEISVNNGVTWYDGSTPSVLAPSDAWYRIKVTNTGTTDLDNVKVNDLVLGIVDYSIGYLAIGDSVTLTNGEIAALFKQDRCTTSGTYVNTATAAGVSLEYPYGSVNDSDAATLVCGGKVDICADGGRPSTLKLQYNGTYESDNEQGRVGVPNLTGPLPSSPVTVKLYDKNELEATINNVNVGDPLTVYGSWTQSGKIPTTVGVEVFYGSKLLQSIAFHGSCSAPLNVGDKFGAVTIIGYTH